MQIFVLNYKKKCAKCSILISNFNQKNLINLKHTIKLRNDERYYLIKNMLLFNIY